GTRADGWPIVGRINPDLVANYVLESAANSFYHAGTVQLSKRFTGHWNGQAHYTWSKALDEVTDLAFEYGPHNQLDPHADRGLSAFHRAHRFVAAGLFESKGWTIAPIVHAESSRPFNVLTGVDNLGDGQVYTHRPLGLGRNTGI